MSIEAARACNGGPVQEIGDFALCVDCGKGVRWDLRDHPFFGFHNCAKRAQSADAVGQRGENPICPRA